MRVAVVGGGAAGFFAAIHAKENHPESEVILFEKSQKVLSKVKVSGGGRCNVTNGCTSIPELVKGYPRGGSQLKKALRVFNTADTRQWYESKGVQLKTEADQRVFPVTDDSQTIIDCLMNEMDRLGVKIKLGATIEELAPSDGQITLKVNGMAEVFDKVICATGGSPKRTGLNWLEKLGHEIEEPVPSLFTFNMPNEPIKKLMGVVCEQANVSIQGTKLKSSGPLLVTHWGMSGPAILRLSAFGARELAIKNYAFNIQVNWANEPSFEQVTQHIQKIIHDSPNKQLDNVKPFGLPDRLWNFLLEKSELPKTKPWRELGKKGTNKLVNLLCHDVYEVKGKTTFKEEFVTCGGVSLSSVQFKTMESKVVPNLYFAGELLDVDGITGGYNFQAAWTTAFIAGKLQ